MPQFEIRLMIALLIVCVMLLCEAQGGWWELHLLWLGGFCVLFAVAPNLKKHWVKRSSSRTNP